MIISVVIETYFGWACGGESERQRMYARLTQLYLVVSQCDKMNFLKKQREKLRKKEVLNR